MPQRVTSLLGKLLAPIRSEDIIGAVWLRRSGGCFPARPILTGSTRLHNRLPNTIIRTCLHPTQEPAMHIVQRTDETSTEIEIHHDGPTAANYIGGGILMLFGLAGDVVDLLIAYNAKQAPHLSHLIEWGLFVLLGVAVMFTKQVLPVATKIIIVISDGGARVFRGRRKED